MVKNKTYKETTPSNYYVDKERLYQELKKYHKAKKAGENPEISEYIGHCILLICNGLSQRPNFNGYTFKADMVSDGIEDCVAAVKNFNPRKSKNPFGYFSQISWWAFVQRILIEKKQQYLKHKNYQNNFMISDLSNTENNSVEKMAWSELSDQVIEGFEKNLTKTKNGSKLKAKVKTPGNLQEIRNGAPASFVVMSTTKKDKNNVQRKKTSFGPRNRKKSSAVLTQ